MNPPSPIPPPELVSLPSSNQGIAIGVKDRPIEAPNQEGYERDKATGSDDHSDQREGGRGKEGSSSSTPQKRPHPSTSGTLTTQTTPHPTPSSQKRRITPPLMQSAVPLSPKSPEKKEFKFPPLESFDEIDRKRAKYCGPTTESNWVVIDKLLVGAYPGVVEDEENMNLLWSILTQRITTFCCLQVEYPSSQVTEEMWRSGKAIRPYFKDVVDIIKHVDEMRGVMQKDQIDQYSNVTNSQNLDFVHVPIVDCSVTDDSTIIRLCKELVERLATGEVIYLHCWGGHGRTGTAICIMLHLMYNLTSFEALRYCQYVHDLRRIPINVGSPQTQMQRDQVIRVIEFLQKEKQREREESIKRAKIRAAKRSNAAAAAAAGATDNHVSANGNGIPNPNSQVQKPDLTIQNGKNGLEIAVAPVESILPENVGKGRNSNNSYNNSNNSSSRAGNSGQGGRRQQNNASGKKSLRQMREANRASQQQQKQQQQSSPSSSSKTNSDSHSDNMMIAGLHINDKKGGNKSVPIRIPTATPSSDGTAATHLPLVDQAPATATTTATTATPNPATWSSQLSSKVDEISQSSPVKSINPQPPGKGSSRKGKGPRAGNRV
eukprot:CAMPEP_0118641952 /NCGR_PEP_ID=MMETSP0785-20121206/5582_1 /TAXON_ID=91992 /ORGANISM="Bolidomonas pacifica, Strain CCMP 1866" /LENGTH=602 /DNA_ID=CAMNT_0006533483 /DNA_START=19 /DNA_END=1823 /DNA_ORIENTATION=-